MLACVSPMNKFRRKAKKARRATRERQQLIARVSRTFWEHRAASLANAPQTELSRRKWVAGEWLVEDINKTLGVKETTKVDAERILTVYTRITPQVDKWCKTCRGPLPCSSCGNAPQTCKLCGLRCRQDETVHAMCVSFQEHIKAGGTLD